MKVDFVRKTLFCVLALLTALPACSQSVTPRYRVAACDWMMLKRQKLGEFQLARQIGADGVEVDMGGLVTEYFSTTSCAILPRHKSSVSLPSAMACPFPRSL